MAQKRIVIWLDNEVRKEVKKRATAEGRLLSAKYLELFLKGYQQEVECRK